MLTILAQSKLMKARDIMTTDVQTVSPDSNLMECSRKMKELGVGAIPACENDRMVGIVTDRDIVIQAIAAGRDVAQVTVREIMSSPVSYCFDDEDIRSVARLMEDRQIRRIAVVSREKRLVGIISLGDLAAKTRGAKLPAEVLEKVSEPGRGQVA